MIGQLVLCALSTVMSDAENPGLCIPGKCSTTELYPQPEPKAPFCTPVRIRCMLAATSWLKADSLVSSIE